MAENYGDAQKVKNKRQNNFMGAAREIKEIPKPQPKAEVLKPEAVSVGLPPIPGGEADPAVVQAQDKLTISKGFIVGTTEDGKVLFKPFGGATRLDIVGYAEYGKAVASDLVSELAGDKVSDIPMLKQGVLATLQALKSLGASSVAEEGKVAS